MPVKLSISLSRKIGEAHYGSRGASVGLEIEAEASLVHRPEEFCNQVAHPFDLARSAVDRELARPPAPVANGAARHGSARSARATRAATPNQVRALRVIAAEQGLDLGVVLRERFGADSPTALSVVEASELIDCLKRQPVAAQQRHGEHDSTTVVTPPSA